VDLTPPKESSKPEIKKKQQKFLNKPRISSLNLANRKLQTDFFTGRNSSWGLQAFLW